MIVAQSYVSLDEFAVAARQWNFDWLQLDRGPLRADLMMFSTGTALMARASYNRRFLQRGASPEGMRTFGFPALPVTNVSWCGHTLDATTLNVFSISGDYEAVSEPGFTPFTVSFAPQRLAAIERVLGLPPIDEIAGTAEHVATCDPRKLDAARMALCRAYGQLDAGVRGAAPQGVAEDLEFEIPKRLLLALWSSAPAKCPRPQRIRDVAFRHALALIDEHAADPITVQEVCRRTGVSWRTLDYAFRERLGTTPKAYIQAARLNAVHRELRTAPSTTKISDVANFWGFWHLGQFAADYRRMFGELPSHTLGR